VRGDAGIADQAGDEGAREGGAPVRPSLHPSGPLNERTQAKILTLAEMARHARALREAGFKVVQAHGTFDLLHLGHVRHLEAARALGDELLVTITPDRFVNKGPGRPVFAEGLRAEMLAALHVVSRVAVTEAPDAIAAIEAIQPHIYAKGSDYQNPEGDVTGKILLERDAVERHGGAIHFTDEITFSSTALINGHFNVFEPHVRRHLSGLRNDGGLDAILGALDRIRDYRVVFVGDAIIDEYQYVLPIGKPPKEHIIATRHQDREIFAGGVFAAANTVADFCREVEVITCLGSDRSHEDFIRRSLRPNVRLRALIRPNAPTTRKERFIDPSSMRKLFEVYHINDEPLTPDLDGVLDGMVKEHCPTADAVIATDFGHGLIGPTIIDRLIRSSAFLAVNTQTNSANMGYNLITRYPTADFICIDAPEARLALSDRVSPIGDLIHHLADRMHGCSKIIVTTGKHGCVSFERGGSTIHTIPAVARRIVDTVGAGDAFFAVTSPLVAAGLPTDLAGFVGNVVGALKVEIIGHRRSVERASLIKAIMALLK
jgi:rfaE bifunctional protein nucleotidyltransferase chain/domain